MNAPCWQSQSLSQQNPSFLVFIRVQKLLALFLGGSLKLAAQDEHDKSGNYAQADDDGPVCHERNLVPQGRPLYALYVIIAVFGYFRWRRQMSKG